MKASKRDQNEKQPFLRRTDGFLFGLKLRLLNFTHGQKTIIAATSTIFIMIGFVYILNNGFSLPFQNSNADNDELANSKLANNPEFQRNLQKLRNITDSYTPTSIVYDTIAYEDLPIYPTGWVERTFNETELKNSLISGPSGDPDNDGLSNKEEYLFGSNPKNQFSLCGTDEGDQRCKLTDKENVEQGISPLTGGAIETNREIVLTKQDSVYIQSIQDSFESASAEGVDFPVLYQESTKIDLSNELGADTYLVVDDSRESFSAYTELRLTVIDGFLTEEERDSEIGSLLTVYQASQIDELEKIKERYQGLLNELLLGGVPQTYVEIHDAFILLLKNLIDVVNHRIDGLNNSTSRTEEFQKISKELAVEVVWAYRAIDIAVGKLDQP